jgi:hypothetical protein
VRRRNPSIHHSSATVTKGEETEDDDRTRGRGAPPRVRELLGDRHPVVAAGTVLPGGTRTAVLGADVDADFEIGSISKGVTGLLYADALTRGELRPTTTLGELLPLDGAPAAGVTLASLATSSSAMRSPARPGPATGSSWTCASSSRWIWVCATCPRTRTGVVLMSATSRSVDHQGFTLLRELTAEATHS